RRHTILQGDWSSDVCSSDLVSACGGGVMGRATRLGAEELEPRENPVTLGLTPGGPPPLAVSGLTDGTVRLYAPLISTGRFNSTRSEERRVGKECRSPGGAAY